MEGSAPNGEVFDGFAEEYDARRSGYPAGIVDAALRLAGLREGSRVVEIGSGTGKLTEELVARGLRVDAVEPGPNMIEVARRRVAGSPLVEFHNARFEDVVLPRGAFEAAFAASSFHWVEPHRGWAKAAELLRPGGTMALLQPLAVRAGEHADAQDAIAGAFRRLAPQITAGRQPLRDGATILSGAEQRRQNASEVWAWLAHPPLAVPEAGMLFGPATLTAVAREREQTAAELWAVFATTSLCHQLPPARRAELRAEWERIVEAAGGTVRSTQLVALVTAQRRETIAA
jgi:ubiquinone/menaquinone biosynthesis C-methylase UbiE